MSSRGIRMRSPDLSHRCGRRLPNVKLPNVNMLVELSDIREGARSYDANVQVVKQARDLVTMTIDLLKA